MEDIFSVLSLWSLQEKNAGHFHAFMLYDALVQLGIDGLVPVMPCSSDASWQLSSVLRNRQEGFQSPSPCHRAFLGNQFLSLFYWMHLLWMWRHTAEQHLVSAELWSSCFSGDEKCQLELFPNLEKWTLWFLTGAPSVVGAVTMKRTKKGSVQDSMMPC